MSPDLGAAHLGAVGARGGEAERVAAGLGAGCGPADRSRRCSGPRPARPPAGSRSSPPCRRLALTSSTLSAVADAPESRNENVTPGRAPTKALVRLVPVSSRGAPVTRGPGTGDSSGFGSGGSGGRISTGLVGARAPAGRRGERDRAGHGTERHARVEAVVAARAHLHGHVVAAPVAAEEGELGDARERGAGDLQHRAAAQRALSRRSCAGR